MRVYWWQGGVHLHPESDEDHKALQVMTRNLKFVDLRDDVKRRPSDYMRVREGDDQESVVSVDESSEVSE